MQQALLVLAGGMMLAATPALAAPCTSQGKVGSAITFPTNRASDVQFARSMVPVMLPPTFSRLPESLTCTRQIVKTAIGDYSVGGENTDDFPRIARRADGKAGPIVYLAASPAAPGPYALVVYSPGASAAVKRFYAGIPTDARLADDLRAALANDTNIMAFDPNRQVVVYGFSPPGGPPPMPSSRGGGGTVAAGPQIMVLGSGDPRLLDTNAHMRHTPSGFACPQSFTGLPVLLMSIDPRADYLACRYRVGTDLRYRAGDKPRYGITLTHRTGETPRSVFDQLVASGRANLRITREHTPPLAAGASPAPELAIFWDTKDDGVQGLWVGQAGGWIVTLRAQYAPGAANDAEAGKVAAALFAMVAEQVK